MTIITKAKRIPYLEGLRGIAALLVVFNHYSLAFYPAVYSKAFSEMHTGSKWESVFYNTPLSIIFAGNFAVYLFFLLSGFVTTFAYFTKGEDKEVLARLSLSRYFRLLFPILICNLVIFFILQFHLSSNTEASTITKSLWWLKGFWQFSPNIVDAIYQALFGILFVNINQTYNTILWPIAYLFYGTFLVSGLLLLTSFIRKRYFIYLLGTIMLITTYFYPFIIGMALADLYFHNRLTFFNKKFFIFFFFLLGIYLGSYPIINSPLLIKESVFRFLPQIYTIDNFSFYHVLGGVLLIVSILYFKSMQSLLSSKIFIFLGKVSYSLYVSHFLLLGSLGTYLFLRFYQHYGYNTAFLRMIVIILPVTLLLAYFIYKFVEIPGKNLGDLFFRYITLKGKKKS